MAQVMDASALVSKIDTSDSELERVVETSETQELGTDDEEQNINSADSQLLETLGRLSKKAGVLATIVLDRASGGILKTTGSLSSSRISLNTSTNSDQQDTRPRELQGIEEMAVMVWNFVNATGGLIHGLDSEVGLSDQGDIYQV